MTRAIHLAFLTCLLPSFAAAAGDGIPVGVAQWPEALGNHRAVVRVEQAAEAVRVRLPWRRPDIEPEKKAVFVFDAKTGKRLENVVAADINREFGDLVFQPIAVPGDYYVYFLPASPTRTGAGSGTNYPPSKDTADAAWRSKAGVTKEDVAAGKWRTLPEARVTEFQALTEFDQFTPMEQIATKAEMEKLLAQHGRQPYLVFPEDRRFPIRMTDDLPQRWIEAGPHNVFEGKASRGEFYAFQIGLYAVKQAIDDVEVTPADLKPAAAGGKPIPAASIRCFNKGGIDWMGRAFDKTVPIGQGKVRALWLGVPIPTDAVPGRYEGAVTIAPRGLPPSRVTLRIDIGEDVLADAGDGEPWRHSRLRWLDSKIALDDEPVPPFPALTVKGNAIGCLGREVTLGSIGLPESVRSYFAPEVTHLVSQARCVLAEPMRFVVETPDGKSAPFVGGEVQFTKNAPGVAAWASSSKAGSLQLSCNASMEFDGYAEFRLQVAATRRTEVKDLRLEIPMRRDVARYMMGMGRPGGLRPPEYQWKWDQAKHQDSVWLGDVNAGLRCRLFGENYRRPLVNTYYKCLPLNLPPAWHNDGRGGCSIVEEAGDRVVLRVTSGPRTVEPGQTLHFYFSLLLTPFKTLNTDAQWSQRYFHQNYWPNKGDDDLKKVTSSGATVLNIHQGNRLNPYINYPFTTCDELKKLIERAHQEKLRVKLYYTVRELSNHVTELWALRSLGDEVLADGSGGGATWLREHLRTGYVPAWYDTPTRDASILTAGMSRWHNYYLEGLNWMARNLEIDGLYIDDVAFDRTVMKRARKILVRSRPSPLIDFHSWNHFNPRAGWACCLNLYMEHLPYVDRVWIGEGRDYNSTPPDYWLVEISGIPFGAMGEMLQGGGNPWRGMVFGMTSRLGWGGNPRALWKLWDEFDMQGSRMIGYWVEKSPVKTDHDGVKATVYTKDGKTLIALASWDKEKVDCRLKIDFAALGLDGSKARLRAPAIEGFQQAVMFSPTDAIPVQPGRGWLLILE